MTEVLLQSALAASKSKGLTEQAAQIRSHCHTHHGASETETDAAKSLISCPECYSALLSAFRTRYLGTAPTERPDQEQQPQQQQPPHPAAAAAAAAAPGEWFAARRAFLAALDGLLDSAREHRVPPQAVDDRVRDERARWYAERVRGSLLRLLMAVTTAVDDGDDDDANAGGDSGSGEGKGAANDGGGNAVAGWRAAVLERLEDLAAASEEGKDPVRLAREIAEILGEGPLAGEEGRLGDVSGRLAAAETEGQERMAGVLREVFFAGEDGSVPDANRKYLDMMAHQGLTMEQVVDRILEERQAASGARDQANELSQRLDELRRARAAHELQKSRKAQRRESLAQQKVPDELYDLPACAVCGSAPRTEDFFSCAICTILAGRGIREGQTVFCSRSCEAKGQASHAEAHLCSSGSKCVLLPQNRKPSTSNDQENPTQNPAPQSPDEARFCTECLTSLRQPTLWCSLACAESDFQRHREEEHLPERKRLGLEVNDEDQLEYFKDNTEGDGSSTSSSSKRYRAKDISAHTTSLDEAAREWEERNKVKLQRL